MTWDRTVRFFKDSEVIFFARLQMLISVIGAVAVSFDFSPVASGTMPSKQQLFLMAILFMQGMGTEYARRRRANEDEKGNLCDKPGDAGRL